MSREKPLEGSIHAPVGAPTTGVRDGDTGSKTGGAVTGPREGMPKSSFIEQLKGVLPAAELADLWDGMFLAGGTHPDMSLSQVEALIGLIKSKQGKKEKIDALVIAKDADTIRTEGLQKAEAERLKQIRDEIDADPAIKAEVDAALSGATSDAKASGLTSLVNTAGAVVLGGITDAAVKAKFQAKLKNAQSLIDAYKADPTEANLSKAREAVEEIVAAKNPKFKEICAMGDCDCK
jgi:hypothetical protein